MMKTACVSKLGLTVALAVAGAMTVAAQNTTPAGIAASHGSEQPAKGFTLFEKVEGSVTDGTTVVDMNTALGYDFNEHFGLNAGIPVFFLMPDGQRGIASNTTGLGNVSVGFHTNFDLGPISYSSSVTAGLPTANTTNGLSTGRVIVDWDNRFDHSWGNVTPYIDIDLSNGINNLTTPNQHRVKVQRPYITLGKEVQFEGGADIKVGRKMSFSMSGYDVVPWGPQKVYSLIVRRGQTGKGSGRNGRVFETAAVSQGTAELDRDEGFNTSVGFQATPVIGFYTGYSRSVRFESNSVSFGVGFNLSQLFHARGQQ